MSAVSEDLQKSGDTFTAPGDRSRRRQSTQQQRQLLSCTKCRERKVKCDRTKPCSACCARGSPKECHFIAENGDYVPIQQSYELRRLRAENLRLKERLRANKGSTEDDESGVASPHSYWGDRQATTTQKRRAARQRRFQGPEWSDSLYFGSPGLANVITDFAKINLTSVSAQSLVHLMPRGSEMYANRVPPPHPFPTMFPHTPDNCIPELLRCLRLEEARDEFFQDLGSFEKRVHICAFPYVPIEITKTEVERFLADPMKNAQMCPDMLALLFAALALGSQHSAWDKSGGKWQADMTHQTLRKGDVYIAAAMQALRVASFMHKPTLLGIQTLIMISPFLTNSGRFLDAWTLFGTTIRLAHSMGLHRHPKYLDPSPPTQRECFVRQTLWWWMLHMDQEFSMTLGRPLGISGIGDCPPPYELTTDPRMLRFGELVNHFTILTRQILSSDRLINTKIDEFTDLLKGLLETMPEMLQFNASWLDDTTDIPEWPLCTMAALFYCKTHTYLILLNRQRIEKHSSPRKMSSYFSPTASSPAPFQSPLRGRELVLSSSCDLLTAFLFFHARNPAALICWIVCQQAYNSCMILLLDAMESGDLTRIGQVERAYVVFVQLQNNGVHELAKLAVERVSWGLAQLRRLKDQKNHSNDQSFEMAGFKRAGSCTADGTREVDMQGDTTDKSEANVAREKLLRDSVMGNTGMLLLEDPGLQSFTPEAFQPLAWNLEKEEWKATRESLVPNERKGEMEKNQGERDGFARSSEQPQGATTPGSAPPRFATYDTAPAHERQEHQPAQPQGPTFSTSPHSDFSSPLHQIHQPHLRHHSYPSLQQTHSSVGPTQHQQMRGENLDTRIDEGNRGQSQPLLHALPELSVCSTSAPNPTLHPFEAARPAAFISNVSDHLARPNQTNPLFMTPLSQRLASTSTWQYDIPHRTSADAQGDNTMSPTYYSSTHNVGGGQRGPRV